MRDAGPGYHLAGIVAHDTLARHAFKGDVTNVVNRKVRLEFAAARADGAVALGTEPVALPIKRLLAVFLDMGVGLVLMIPGVITMILNYPMIGGFLIFLGNLAMLATRIEQAI